MGGQVLELEADKIKVALDNAYNEGMNVGTVKAVVTVCKKAGFDITDAVESVVSETGLPQGDAEALVKKYW